jgi:hypothetical protein
MERDKSLENAIEAVRRDEADPAVVAQAVARVRQNLDGGSPALTNSAPARLRTCADFRALIPAYREGTLGESRRALLEDHLHECVDCRRVHEGAPARVVTFDPARRRTNVRRPLSGAWRWSVAAALLAGVVVGSAALLSPPGSRASVESVDGGLYLVSESGMAPLASPVAVREGAEVRTGRGGHAVLRLHDGSRIEMAERTGLSVSRGWLRTVVHLEKGDIIVQAAKQGWIHRLQVATADARATVKGTIFAVSAGEKGSRVSVVEGAVQVDAGRVDQTLKPGEQATSSPALLKTPVASEVSWSRDATRYYALMADLKVISAKLDQIPSPGLRYQSRLIPLLPAGTVFVAAIPNIGNTLVDARRVFEERLSQSEVLREWWASQGPNASQFNQAIDKLHTLSQYLGDEVVIAMPAPGRAPLMIAEVRNSGLRDFISSEVAKAGAPPAALTELDQRLVIANNLAIASPDSQVLAEMRAAATAGATSGFLNTPFGAQIAAAYRNGASWLFCADLEQIALKSVHSGKDGRGVAAAGVSNVRYLVIERKEAGGKTESAASVAFAGQRQGVASWLGAPAKMNSLEFISPDATFAFAFVIKSPQAVFDDFVAMMKARNPEFNFAEIEQKLGLRIREDIIQALGSDVSVSIDGALLPTPAWKAVIEIYDAARLEQAIEQIVKTASANGVNVTFASETAAGRELHHLTGTSPSGATQQAWYTFADGYLIAAATRESVLKAVENHLNGYTLTRSDRFLSRLPQDGQANFSAVLYENVGPALAPLAGLLAGSSQITPAQKQALDTLAGNSDPAMVYAYGEADRIRLGTTSNLLGVILDAMVSFAPQARQGGIARASIHGAHHHRELRQ